MNSEYSQLIGSFQRTGNFPLEAEYEFSSYAALSSWAQDPINYSTLYPGLKKLVKFETGEQFEYWVVERDGVLVFELYNGYSTGGEITDPDTDNSIYRTNIEETEYKQADQILVITLKRGDYQWKEQIPLNSIIETIRDEFSEQISKDAVVQDLTTKLKVLQGQVDAILATGGGSGGSSIDKIEIISIEFITGNKTYIVDPNKLTEEEQENGVDIPIRWEYNINLNNNDKQYIYLDGVQAYQLEGPVTEFTLPGVKKSTTVKVKGLSKSLGLQTESEILRITFGITIYKGSSPQISSLTAQVISPKVDDSGKQYILIDFEPSTLEEFRYFAIPKDALDQNVNNLLVQSHQEYNSTDSIDFELQGFDTSSVVDGDGVQYHMYKLDNILHGSFTIKISNK